jgi:hypothetical protein
MNSVKDNIAYKQSILPAAAKTASADGTGVDTAGFHSAAMLVAAGDIDTTTGDETYAFKVQDSADNSTFADVSGATTTITADNTAKMVAVPEGHARYLRVVATLAGTTPSILVAAGFLLGKAESNPVTTA